jgi:hypothetical protein
MTKPLPLVLSKNPEGKKCKGSISFCVERYAALAELFGDLTTHKNL